MKIKPGNPQILGIIVCYDSKLHSPPFAEAPFFHQLSTEGDHIGVKVIIFDPKEVDWSTRTAPCWHIDEKGKWKSAKSSIPSVIYDRCYYVDQIHFMEYRPHVLKLMNDPNTRFLGRALGGKIQTHEMLQQNPELRPFLPMTVRYQTPSDVMSLLNNHSAILVKPNGGSHGRGIFVITPTHGKYQVRGRSKQNKPFTHLFTTPLQLSTWMKSFIGKTRYIIQPFLALSTPDHRPFDVRILIQKNEKAIWQTTGSAVRVGLPHMVTSNLHGGGKATALRPFLDLYHTKEQIESIMEDMDKISTLVPTCIEEKHGPLLELGLDIGIDPTGHLWILEVNSKPGRSIFLQTGDKEIRQRAVQLPVNYAHTLLMSS